MHQIDFSKIIEKNIPSEYSSPRRSQIYVGFQCHQKCGFCYYKSKCSDNMFPIDKVIQQIDIEFSYGIKDFEITGGEPGECKNLRYYCEYIKKRNPNSKISIITNGSLYSSNIWDIIDEVLISYHTGQKNIDKTIFPNGSTFQKILKTVEKAKENNVLIRTNTIIAEFNLNNFEDIVKDIVQYIQPRIINFLPLNLFDESDSLGMQKFIDYSKVKPILKKSIDYIEKSLPNRLIFIRYISYCQMEGYEKYIVNTIQHAYDWFDWNIELSGIVLLKLIDTYKDSQKIIDLLLSTKTLKYKKAFNDIQNFYEKSDLCIKCKYFMICDGVEKTKDHRLFKYIQPTKGKMIKNCLEFIKNTTEVFYKQYYGK